MLASRIEQFGKEGTRWRGFVIRASEFKEERTNFRFTKSFLHPHKNNIVHRR